jgi:hypothetical protein
MIASFLHRTEFTDPSVGHRAVWFLATTLLAMFANPASAQTNAPCDTADGNWCLRISEKEKQLVHYNEPEWMKPLMWDIGITRNDYYRNLPTLELSNVADAGEADITQFMLTIGDTRFHFEDDFIGAPAVLGESTMGKYKLISSISPDGNLLTVNIQKEAGTGGLAPGDLVRFRIDIDVDAGLSNPPFYQYPDFRTVLFDKNGVQVYGNDPAFPNGAEDNAQATVKFSDGSTQGPTPLPDFTVTGAQNEYFNATYHPRGVMEGVDIFTIGGGPAVIPEPGSAVLALFGVVGATCGMRKRRVNS